MGDLAATGSAPRMLSEPAASLTDLALGVITLTLLPAMRVPHVSRYWRRTVGWAAAAALAGFVHHGFVTYSNRWAGPSWAIISGMVVIAISFSLAASVQDVLGPGRGRTFWALRSASLGAYVTLAAFGHYGIATILACEGVTMLAILALWGIALRHGHPRAPAVIAALGASVIAGSTRALPADVTEVTGLDPTSVYHLAQIPAMVVLCWALIREPRPGWYRPRRGLAQHQS